MMNKGLVTHSIKIKVMQMLKSAVINIKGTTHGDMKDFFGFNFPQNFRLVCRPNNKPENILVDYDISSQIVTNFKCILADWGTSGYYHPGGTPVGSLSNVDDRSHRWASPGNCPTW